MKRFILVLGLFLMTGLPALAQEPAWPVFALGAQPDLAGANFSPYFPAAYRGSCGAIWQRQRQEDAFLRQRQWRERQACSSSWRSGRCRNLGWRERHEWERLRARQRTQRARLGCY
jgi:hypothetical protein